MKLNVYNLGIISAIRAQIFEVLKLFIARRPVETVDYSLTHPKVITQFI